MTDKSKAAVQVTILAAGMGSRMKSAKPKVLHAIAGKSMLGHLLDTTEALNPVDTIVVIGQGADQIQAKYAEKHQAGSITWAMQEQQLGTGHAMQQAIPHLIDGMRVLMLVGDAPLLRLETMRRLLTEPCDLGILTVNQPKPFNYGRIIRDGERLLQIVEEKDCSADQREITEINSGIMIADAAQLKQWLVELKNDNVQAEYLLTDIVKIANAKGANVRGILTDDHGEVQGVNNFSQLADLETYYQQRIATDLMLNGVHIVDPKRLNLRGNLTTGSDCSIDINCIFEGDVVLGNNVTIGANCIIKDSSIGDGSVIKPNTMLDGAMIAEECAIGPFARIRPGTEVANKAAIGNFVETKKTKLGVGSKSGHLTYLGDAIIGAGVNIGAGTITCNYDGVNKFVTEIEDGVFIGSNSSLVAPVSIKAGATVAAGSTITKTVNEKSLGIGRGKQKNIDNWKGPRDS